MFPHLFDREVGVVVADERVGALSDGEDHGVDVDVELEPLMGTGLAPAGRSGFAELHPDNQMPLTRERHPEDGRRAGEHHDLDALFFGVFDLFNSSGISARVRR